jgi:hypothetical protein
MDCPEFDELSVWHDGESDAASIDAHIANCGDCQATLDSLERIDGSLLGPAPTAKTLARIQAGCMRELRKPAPRPSPILSMQLVTRLAAMFALVGIALFMRDKLKELEPGVPANLGQPTSAAMINHMAEAPPVPPPAPTAAVVAVSANLPPPVPAAPIEAIAESATPAPRLVRNPARMSKPAVSVDYDAIKLVAAGPESRRGLHGQRVTIAAPTQNEVPDVVRHVWLADDVVAPLKALRDLMPQDNRAKLDELVQGEADNYSLTLSATDRNLQALVDHMASLGMVLVSPDAPQPQAAASGLLFSGKTVRYQVDFVKK